MGPETLGNLFPSPSQVLLIQCLHFILYATSETWFHVFDSFSPASGQLNASFWLIEKGLKSLKRGQDRKGRALTRLPPALVLFIWGVYDSPPSSPTRKQLPSNPRWVVEYCLQWCNRVLRLQGMLVLLEFFQQTHLIVAAPWRVLSHSQCL